MSLQTDIEQFLIRNDSSIRNKTAERSIKKGSVADRFKEITDLISSAYTTTPWENIQNKPTTIAGYGISDAWTKTESDERYIQPAVLNGYLPLTAGLGKKLSGVLFANEGIEIERAIPLPADDPKLYFRAGTYNNDYNVYKGLFEMSDDGFTAMVNSGPLLPQGRLVVYAEGVAIGGAGNGTDAIYLTVNTDPTGTAGISVQDDLFDVGIRYAANYSANNISNPRWLTDKGYVDGLTANYIPLSQKGAASGVVPLGSDVKIPAIYLPGYVDDVIEVANYAALPVTGEADKLYVTQDTNKTYRWSGSLYVEVSPSDVNSVFGRTGIISALESDYNSFYPLLSGSYNNPSWINSLAYGKLIGAPDLSIYIPYTGATANINLGSNTLIAEPAYIGSWSGSSTYARFGHKNFNNGTEFGLIQGDDGSVHVKGVGLNISTTTGAINAASPVNVTGQLLATTLVKSGGVSSEFLKADGSVDTNSYLIGSSLSATSPIFYNSGTGVISSQAASGSQHGYLLSTDWTTFNNKLSTTGDGSGLSGVMLLTGAQTAAGVKTFSSPIKTQGISNTVNNSSVILSGGSTHNSYTGANGGALIAAYGNSLPSGNIGGIDMFMGEGSSSTIRFGKTGTNYVSIENDGGVSFSALPAYSSGAYSILVQKTSNKLTELLPSSTFVTPGDLTGYVTVAGTQTITGAKTFSANVSSNTNGTSFQWTNAGNGVAMNATSGVWKLYTGTSYTEAISVSSSQQITLAGALTGTSATFNGLLSSTKAGNILSATTTSSSLYMNFTNTGGLSQIGIDNSSGSDYGGSPYSMFLYHGHASPIYIGNTNGTAVTVNSDRSVVLASALTGTSATFSGKLAWGTGTYTAGVSALYNNASNGTILISKTGSSTDFVLTNGVGSSVMEVPAGTTNTTFSGNVAVGGGSTTHAAFKVANANAMGLEFSWNGGSVNGFIQMYDRTSLAYGGLDYYALSHKVYAGSTPTLRYTMDSNGDNLWTGVGRFDGTIMLSGATRRINFNTDPLYNDAYIAGPVGGVGRMIIYGGSYGVSINGPIITNEISVSQAATIEKYLNFLNTTAPSTPSGGVLYVESGALKYKGSSGTITTLGPA